ncbi:MAG: hypothetical protein ACP5HQ_06380 [Thermoprotei archaeon]
MGRRRSMKAISSIMGTLIILAITMALGGLLYMYSQTLFNNLTKTTNIPITAQIYSAGSAGAVVYLSVQNTGNQVVQINSLKLMYQGQVLGYNGTLNIVIPAGSTYSTYIYLRTSQPVVAGNSYLILVQGSVGNDQQFGQVINVVANR